MRAIALASKNEQVIVGKYVNPSADAANRTAGTGLKLFSFGQTKKKTMEQGDKSETSPYENVI